MSVDISDDFSTDPGNYSALGSVDTGAGELSMTGAGTVYHDTPVSGTGAYWIGYTMEDVPGTGAANTGPAFGGSSAGSGPLLILTTGANSSVNLDWMTQYNTYTTYSSEPDSDLADQQVVTGVTATGWRLGMTVDPSDNVVRFWVDPVAQEPAGVNDWDGGSDAAATSIDLDIDTNHVLGGRYVGIGNWGSGQGVISLLEFGPIGTASGSSGSGMLSLLGVG